jgi:SAM-dependent methyltransferase
MPLSVVDPACEAYEALAFAYDALSADYPYDRWLPALERLARAHGLRGKRLLDVACGTGKSFVPLLERDYDVTACDLSEAMLRRAAEKAPGVPLYRLDMRELGVLGEFDLVTCLDDSLNYLLREQDLRAALAGLRRNLAPEGVAVWDLNALAMYRAQFASDWVVERDGVFIAWQGLTDRDLRAGARARARIDVFADPDADAWRRVGSEHVQRHWPRECLESAAADAGLRVLAVHGQHRGAVLDADFDELVHTKAVYVACRDDRPAGRGGGSVIGNP